MIFSIIDNYYYKSEWLDKGTVIMITILASVIFSIMICLLSLSIFLNKISMIRNSFVLSILSWILLPYSLLIIFLIYQIRLVNRLGMIYMNDFVYVLIMIIPFMISLILTFIKYRKEITTANTVLRLNQIFCQKIRQQISINPHMVFLF